MKYTSNVTLIAAVVAAVAVVSPAAAEGPGWTVSSAVVRLVNTADGGINVRLSPELNSCVSPGGYGPNYASIRSNHPGINRIKADLLTALTTGMRVALYLADDQCTVTETILIAP